MKTENNNLKKTALASGAALLATFGLSNANAADLLNYEDLGTASELRSNLITADALNAFTSNTDVEFECGEGKCGEKTKKKADGKSEKASAKPAAESSSSTSKATMKAASPAKATSSEVKPAKKEMKTETKSDTPNN